MSRQLNPSQIWSQVPVANRLIEVNTKTGFSLTAGSYVVTGSVQRGNIAITNGLDYVTATVSSVTITKTALGWTGNNPASTTYSNPRDDTSQLKLTNSTTVTNFRSGSVGGVNSEWQLVPYV